MRALVCALSLVGVCLVGACDDGGDSGADAEKVTRVLTRAAEDPDRATSLLTGRATGDLATDAEEAGIPSEDVVAWLLEDHGFPNGTTDAAGRALTVAAQPTAGRFDDEVADEMVGSSQVTPALRLAVAEVLVDRVPELMSSATTNRPWSPDDLAHLLGELGGDSTVREMVSTAITDHAHTRISDGNLTDDAIEAKVLRPTGWLVAAMDAAAIEGLGDRDVTTYVDDRELALETLAEQSMLNAGRSKRSAQAMATKVVGSYTEALEAAD